ncbi:hypothetical protein, partial [Pseudomonas ogarae]|uniref:hypothetical protein n=1 Tax=Pseudomonas TaxID=286 RepID=UPI00391B2953
MSVENVLPVTPPSRAGSLPQGFALNFDFAGTAGTHVGAVLNAGFVVVQVRMGCVSGSGGWGFFQVQQGFDSRRAEGGAG